MPYDVSIVTPVDMQSMQILQQRRLNKFVYGVVNTMAHDPTHGGSHWLAFRADVVSMHVHIYDPLGHTVRQVPEAIMRVIELARNCLGSHTPLRSVIVPAVGNGPTQQDGSSCGLFAAYWVAHAGLGGGCHVSLRHTIQPKDLVAMRIAFMSVCLKSYGHQV